MELNLTTTFAFSIAIAVVSFLVAAYFYVWVKKCPSSNKKIESIGKLIAKGANAFLRREYLVLARFVAVAPRGRLHRTESVRARAGFGDRPRADRVETKERQRPLLLLTDRAARHDRARGQADTHAHRRHEPR